MKDHKIADTAETGAAPVKKKKRFWQRGWFIVLCCVLGFFLLFGLTFALTLNARRQTEAQRTAPPTSTPTAIPSPTPVPERNYDKGETLSFDPDTSALGMEASVLEDFADELGAAYWVDVTPDSLKAVSDAIVIRHTLIECSYLVQDGAYYRLGEGLGGYGVMDMLVCDLNFDGTNEILYTYSFGNQSEYTSKVGWFDLAAHTDVHSDFSLPQGNLALANEDGACILYRCTRGDGATEGGYVLYLGDRLGELVEDDSALFLLLA